jgi:phosphate starvation-inducible protein PhoH and related proteins
MKNKKFDSKDKSPLIPQRGKINYNLSILERNDITPKQKEFLDIALNKDIKMIFVSGPAGTAKTFMSVYCSLVLMDQKRISDLIYVRSTVECTDSKIGFLPGEISDKMSPYIQPLLDKLEELLPKNEINFLKKEERISGIPISFLRGLNWNAKAVILDEAQNCTSKELITFITRIGQFSKVFVIGDPGQSDINGKSGFLKMVSQFDDDESKENGIYVFRFDENDIVRSGLVKFIINKLNRIC